MKKYFNCPTQVMFCQENGEWASGIAYCDEIICGCCGGVMLIEEIYEFAPKSIKNPIHIYENWIDLTEEIQGGELPDSLAFDGETGLIVEVSD